MKTNQYVMNQWYGYDAYDGAYHFFIIKEEVLVFIDTFSDGSSVHNKSDGIAIVQEIDESFKDITKYISQEEFESFYHDTPEVLTKLLFIELQYKEASDFLEPFFNADWDAERRCVLSS